MKYLSIATLLVATNVFAAGSCVICPYGYSCAGGTNAPVKSTPPSTAPIGSIVYMAYGTEDEPCPNGYIYADGRILARTGDYADLFAVLGTTYGTDPENVSITFKLPDLRGMFIRGIGGNSAELGEFQDSDNKEHTHNTEIIRHGYWAGTSNTGWDAFGSNHSEFENIFITSTSSGGDESRPVNYAMYACIKY